METAISPRRDRAGVSAAAIRDRAAGAATATVVALVIVSLAAADGGYFAESWGWSALVLLWIAALVCALTTIRLGRLELAFLGALTALAAWIGLSTLWTSSSTLTVPELERVLVYVAACWAGLVAARATSVEAIVVGVWAATSLVSLYSLATRLFPRSLGVFDPVAGYRLSEPIGYWNALGLFAGIGALLALALVAHGRGLVPPVAAASLVVLLPTIYFTFSRGAWIALGIGVLAAIAADPRRLRLVTAVLAVALWAVLGVAVAYQSDALARVGTSLEAAATDGRRVALALVVLAAVAAGAAVVFTRGARRLDVAPGVRRWYGVGLASLAILSVVLVFVRFGSPPTLARDAYDAFTSDPAPIRDGNLRTRLFSLSGSGRDEQWRVAWAEAKANPWLGSGAGTYERAWVRDRPVAGVVHDAHSLYLETLAELGPIGLALLLTALGLPVVAAVAARSHPLVPATLGAYVAYLAHAAVDWDWELPAVTLAALGCAVAVLAAARDVDAASWSRRGRGVAIAATVGCALAAVVGLAANNALAAGRDALDAGSWSTARDRAATARRWAPWSAEPWEVLGKAQFGSGDRAAARASFEKAIAKDPNDWNLWFYLALASEGRARERAVAQARRLNPLSPEIASLGEERADAGS